MDIPAACLHHVTVILDILGLADVTLATFYPEFYMVLG